MSRPLRLPRLRYLLVVWAALVGVRALLHLLLATPTPTTTLQLAYAHVLPEISEGGDKVFKRSVIGFDFNTSSNIVKNNYGRNSNSKYGNETKGARADIESSSEIVMDSKDIDVLNDDGFDMLKLSDIYQMKDIDCSAIFRNDSSEIQRGYELNEKLQEEGGKSANWYIQVIFIYYLYLFS